MNNDETYIRFGLGLKNADGKTTFSEEVLAAFDELETIRRKEREAYKAEIAKLKKENDDYKQAYFDQWYNDREIEKCWSVIGGYNRKHLELHEAIREYIRNREWNYGENLYCKPDAPVFKVKYYKIYSLNIKEVIGVCTSDGLKHAQDEERECEFIEITKEEFDKFDETHDEPKFGLYGPPRNANFPPHSTEQKIKGR